MLPVMTVPRLLYTMPKTLYHARRCMELDQSTNGKIMVSEMVAFSIKSDIFLFFESFLLRLRLVN